MPFSVHVPTQTTTLTLLCDDPKLLSSKIGHSQGYNLETTVHQGTPNLNVGLLGHKNTPKNERGPPRCTIQQTTFNNIPAKLMLALRASHTPYAPYVSLTTHTPLKMPTMGICIHTMINMNSQHYYMNMAYKNNNTMLQGLHKCDNTTQDDFLIFFGSEWTMQLQDDTGNE